MAPSVYGDAEIKPGPQHCETICCELLAPSFKSKDRVCEAVAGNVSRPG